MVCVCSWLVGVGGGGGRGSEVCSEFCCVAALWLVSMNT